MFTFMNPFVWRLYVGVMNSPSNSQGETTPQDSSIRTMLLMMVMMKVIMVRLPMESENLRVKFQQVS